MKNNFTKNGCGMEAAPKPPKAVRYSVQPEPMLNKALLHTAPKNKAMKNHRFI
jgi:hypothetical protein